MYLQENTFFDLDRRSRTILLSTLYLMGLMLRQSLKWLSPRFWSCIYKKIHWGQSHTKCCSVPSTSCDLCTCTVWSYYTQRFRKRCIYKKCDWRTHAQMKWTIDWLWFQLIYPFLSKKKASITSLKLKYPASGEGKTMFGIQQVFISPFNAQFAYMCEISRMCHNPIFIYSWTPTWHSQIFKKIYCIYNLLVCLPYFTIKCATRRHSIQCWSNMCY